MLRWVAVLALAGCGTTGAPSMPYCEDLGCKVRDAIVCNDKGACECSGERCVADKPRLCAYADASDTTCSDLVARGWTTYECNDDLPDPDGMECIGHEELASRYGLDYVSVRCCRPML